MPNENTISKVCDFITKHNLLHPERFYLVALSGGADSTALLLLMHRLGYKVEAVHCNFKLRGDESERDMFFCQNLCQKLGLKLHTLDFDTEGYAKKHKVSIEMAARVLRYDYFDQLSEEVGADAICVAHHADDCVETLFVNLIRGTGIKGLTGISSQNGKIIRPLLCLRRSEIIQFLQEEGQPFVTDSTNLSSDYVRNKIRKEIIPKLKEINPSVETNITKTISHLNEAWQVLQAISQDVHKDILVAPAQTGQEVLKVNISELNATKNPSFFLFETINPFGFSSTQTTEILTAISRNTPPTGKHWEAPPYILCIDREYLIIAYQAIHADHPLQIDDIGAYHCTPNGKLTIERHLVDVHFEMLKVPFSVTMDADKVSFPLTLRKIKTGDKFIPLGMTGFKLISNFLTDAKVSYIQRKHQLVLTDANNNIIWLVGHRIDQRVRLTSRTQAALNLHFDPPTNTICTPHQS